MGATSPGVIFDAPVGEGIDGILALALLYGLEGKNDCRLAAVSVSRYNLHSAALCEVLGRFYAGTITPFTRILPVGMPVEGKPVPDTAVAAVAAQYEHGVHKLNDTADVAACIRNAFTAQADGNAVVVMGGGAGNLARALELPGARELAARKVRALVITPAFSDASAAKLLAAWPTPVYMVGEDVGAAVPFPAESIEKDFAWSQKHPVVDAYHVYRPSPEDAPAPTMGAALFAVRPKEGYFQVSEPGTLQALAGGRMRFAPSPAAKHYRLTVAPEQKERIVKVYRELASAQPVPRAPRFRQQQKKQDEKAPEKK